MEYVKKKKNEGNIITLTLGLRKSHLLQILRKLNGILKVIMFVSSAKYSAKLIKYVFQTGEFIPNIKITEEKNDH